MKLRIRVVLTLTTLLATAAAGADSKVLHLRVGDPERRDREVPVVLDAVTDTATGDLLTPAELARRLSDARIVFVGESHTSIDFHRAQLRLVQELDRAGREVLIGLEMYPYTEQEHLDRWHRGLLTEEGFVTLSHWYRSWGYPWDYYRDIFLYARDLGLPLFAVNAPREVVSQVREKGFENLGEEEREHVPERIDLDSDEHRRLFRAYFEPEEDEEEGEDGEGGEGGGLHSGMSDEQLEAMFAAQVTWDATMGHNAVRALREHGGPDAVMVVLIGSGHVAYGLGIERQVRTFFDGGTATVIPIPVADADGEPTPTVRASYADFVWGLPPESDALYPSLGLSTTAVSDDDPRRRVIFADEGSAAGEAGVVVGDLLLALDGEPLPDRETLQRRMADKRWGDAATLTVEREGEAVEVPMVFRREAPGGDGE
jgi:uncharacterized iron-regulated protein